MDVLRAKNEEISRKVVECNETRLREIARETETLKKSNESLKDQVCQVFDLEFRIKSLLQELEEQRSIAIEKDKVINIFTRDFESLSEVAEKRLKTIEQQEEDIKLLRDYLNGPKDDDSAIDVFHLKSNQFDIVDCNMSPSVKDFVSLAVFEATQLFVRSDLLSEYVSDQLGVDFGKPWFCFVGQVRPINSFKVLSDVTEYQLLSNGKEYIFVFRKNALKANHGRSRILSF
ncbi:hypothetical protein HDE_04114 [Halotydeus destructor]|nr:hypothetical protein HDE_04114 [Halotydeus destructor]